MRKTIAALAFATLGTGAVFALAGTAGAETLPSTTANQQQSANNTNTTDQQASTLVSIPQVNLNLPVSILSAGSQTGDVDQSNRADVTASSGNDNSSSQGMDNAQRGEASSAVESTVDNTLDRGAGRGGDASIGDTDVTGGDATLDQSQSADNANRTDQRSETRVDVPQSNINLPISVLSPGSQTGDVTQSNDAVVNAESGNVNDSVQGVDQTQEGSATSNVTSTVDNAIAGHGDSDDRRDRRDGGRFGSDRDRGGDASIGDTTVTGGDATLHQDQSADNSNETNQDATTTVDVPQSNSNEADTRIDGRHHRDGRWNDGRWNDSDHGDVTTGDVTQSNDAVVNAESGNVNDSVQGVDQTQEGAAASDTFAELWSTLMAGVS